MPQSHFDGKRFHNQYPSQKDRSLKEVFRWIASRKPAKWPRHLHSKAQKIPAERVEGQEIRATFINHSTVLIQTQGLNILTDPIWSKRCSPFPLMGPTRAALPGVKFEDLPPIDIVLVSHNHYDHMDMPTLKRLNRKHHPAFFVSLGNRSLLHKNGIKNVTEMDWWEVKEIASRARLTYVPSQHFSGRGMLDQNKTLWGGFVIETEARPIYFAGDTGYGTHFKHIRNKFGPIGFAMLPIGVYLPRWFMSPVHMSPDEAAIAHMELESGQSIGIHYGTFRLGDESIDAPIKDLEKALQHHGIAKTKFIALNHGEELSLPTSKNG